jgi:hypothetical protein
MCVRGALVITAVLALTTGASSQGARTPDGPIWRIASRYDDHRVVILLDGGQLYVPQRDLPTLGQVFRAPQAKLLGDVVEVSGDHAREIVNGRAQVGDSWLLDAGQRGWLHATVERLVIGDVECGEGWGVMAAIAPEDLSTFAAIREKYYPARRDSGPAQDLRAAAAGGMTLSLSSAQHTELTALLDAEFKRTWPEVRREAEEMYAREGPRVQSGWAVRRHTMDVRLDHGEGALDYDVQAFRLTPDGDARLFVRAEWTVGSQTAYLLGAWVRVSTRLTVERIDVRASLLLRFAEAPHHHVSRQYLGQILNIGDTDRDGWGEIIFYQPGFDGFGVQLLEYSNSPTAPLSVITTFDHGC